MNRDNRVLAMLRQDAEKDDGDDKLYLLSHLLEHQSTDVTAFCAECCS
jgi:hypothetical protein